MKAASEFTIYNALARSKEQFEPIARSVMSIFLLSALLISISPDLNAQSPLQDSVKASFKNINGIQKPVKRREKRATIPG